MAFRVEVSTKGGARVRRHLAEQARRSKAIARDDHTVKVGFRGPVAGIAALHEFGHPASNIPERPVLRPASRGVVLDAVRGKLRDTSGLPKRADLYPVARAGGEALRGAYLAASPSLQAVGERQARRKAGTVGEDRPLVGPEGPKMIESASGFVGDDEAD